MLTKSLHSRNDKNSPNFNLRVLTKVNHHIRIDSLRNEHRGPESFLCFDLQFIEIE